MYCQSCQQIFDLSFGLPGAVRVCFIHPVNLAKKLRNTALCKQLDDDELAAIVDIASGRNLHKGESLFWQGDEAAGFFLLLSGSVRIYKSSPDGKEYTMHVVKPGQMFAEAAIFHGSGYPANCAALEDSMIVFFPRDRFVNLIKTSPEISMKMIAALSGFLRELAHQLEELSLKEVPARLASFLLDQIHFSNTDTVKLRTSKTELAHQLGTISETLSRNLKKFKELGIIEVDGKTIRVLDNERLSLIADGEKI